MKHPTTRPWLLSIMISFFVISTTQTVVSQTVAHSVESGKLDSLNRAGQHDCESVPAEYLEKEFGNTLYALETSCQRTFSPKEQLFIAGLSQALLEHCDLPADIESRTKLASFLTSSMLVAIVGGSYGDPSLEATLKDQISSTAAYTVGAAAAQALECKDPVASLLAHGIINYLDRTSMEANFVNGCVKYYSGKYTEEQCQCIADLGRSVFPNIHQMEFSPQLIKQIIKANPFVGLQVALQCGIGDY